MHRVKVAETWVKWLATVAVETNIRSPTPAFVRPCARRDWLDAAELPACGMEELYTGLPIRPTSDLGGAQFTTSGRMLAGCVFLRLAMAGGPARRRDVTRCAPPGGDGERGPWR